MKTTIKKKTVYLLCNLKMEKLACKISPSYVGYWRAEQFMKGFEKGFERPKEVARELSRLFEQAMDELEKATKKAERGEDNEESIRIS